MRRILLIEPECAIAESLAQALRHAGYRISTATTGAHALELAARHAFDLVVLDGTLPDADGRDLCDTLHERTGTPVVMLADSRSEADRYAWSDGAEDYIVKPVRSEDVIARVRGVLRRIDASAHGGEVLRAGPLTLDTITQRARLDGRELELAPKELQLLARLMRDAGSVVSRRELIADVWGDGRPGAARTLDVHVGWLRRKLGDDPAEPRFVHTVRGAGFRLGSPAELAARRARRAATRRAGTRSARGGSGRRPRAR